MVSFVEAMEFLSTSAAVTPCVMHLDFFLCKTDLQSPDLHVGRTAVSDSHGFFRSRLMAQFNLSTGTWGKMPFAPSNPKHSAR